MAARRERLKLHAAQERVSSRSFSRQAIRAATASPSACVLANRHLSLACQTFAPSLQPDAARPGTCDAPRMAGAPAQTALLPLAERLPRLPARHACSSSQLVQCETDRRSVACSCIPPRTPRTRTVRQHTAPRHRVLSSAAVSAPLAAHHRLSGHGSSSVRACSSRRSSVALR